MKVEVINRSTKTTIETYSVADFSMFDFQEWKNLRDVVIHLNRLSDAVAELDSKDSETQEPVSNPQKVDFYLPDPIKNLALSQFAKSQTDPTKFADEYDKVKERISTPALKSSTILASVVMEILQNHPDSDYEVRISDE